ncbi:MAG TPA: DUF1592 domain-containing protein [Bryobacteraceae bacterium]
MRRYSISLILLATGVLCWSPGATSQTIEAPYTAKVQPFVKQYCVACHNSKAKVAGIVLDQYASADSIGGDNGTWEKVLRKLRTGEMPPKGMPQPKTDDRAYIVQYLETELDRNAAEHPDPGRVSIHRLNKAEYNNAVRDVLGIDFTPADDFPPDDAGYGFDNIADVLSMPPVLMEKYLSAANKVSRMAVGNVKIDPFLDRTTLNRKESQAERLTDTVPVGTRGGALISHRFPVDAEYLIRGRLTGDVEPGRHPILDFRLDGKRIKTEEIRFSDKEEDEDTRRVELRTPITAGVHEVVVTFLRESLESEEAAPERDDKGHLKHKKLSLDYVEIGGPFHPTGPGNTLSRQTIFSCRPDDKIDGETCATQILGRLARRAYRRPVTARETASLVKFYKMGFEDSNGNFESGIQLALKAMLVSPNFLFRLERDDLAKPSPSGIRHLTDLELASRLSFFLWSSVPDEQLLSVAEKGQLQRPDVLTAQVKRMLNDPKSKALVANFAGQWLHLRNLALIKPDPEVFPDFDDSLRNSARRETEMFFQAIVKEDRSILDFINGKYTFLNERLAKFYGIPGVKGNQFRRVDLDGSERSGVITQASILTVTSYPTRTSPVIRGKWILENLLGAPPPPPPPGIPDLKTAGIGQEVSMRQQLEEHRANPSCAVCHARMDPLGFALENYNAIGHWRTEEGKFPIDATGKLANGESFKNAAELKTLLLEQKGEFVQCLTEKLLTYALGRGLERYDKPVVRSISRDLAANGYRFSSLVMGIVNSEPFTTRRTLSTEVTENRTK